MAPRRIDRLSLGARLDPAEHRHARRHARGARGDRVRRRHQRLPATRAGSTPTKVAEHAALQGARRRADRARTVRGPDDRRRSGRSRRTRFACRPARPCTSGRPARTSCTGSSIPRHNINMMLLPGQIAHAAGALRHAGRVPDHLSRVLRDRAPHDGRQDHRRGQAMTAVGANGSPRRTSSIALVALFGGVVTGLFQALEYARRRRSTRRWRP